MEEKLSPHEGIKILDFSKGLPVLVTQSSIRKRVAEELGLPIDPSIDVGINEKPLQMISIKEDSRLFPGLTPLRINADSPPLPMVLAMDKALVYLRKKRGEEANLNFFCVDSVWGLTLPETLADDLGEKEILIHKPQSNVSDLIQLFSIIKNHHARLESISAVVQCQGGFFSKKLMRVIFPLLREDLDLDKLEKIISDNGNFAAGLSSSLILEHPDWFFKEGDEVEIIIEDYDQILIVDKNSTDKEFKEKSDPSYIPPYSGRKERHILSVDSTNYSSIMRASLGLLF
jgi:hypothetical protein